MLFYDVTKSARQRHHSGLTRMSRCLRSALAETSAAPVIDVVWHPRRRRFVTAEGRRPVDAAPDDWLLTPEIFCEAERPGFADWMAAAPGRKAVIYYDAIPLKFPEICWPQSVARHPGYMKLLAAFDRVLAISRASAEELSAYWQWIGVRQAAPVALQLGADGHGSPRWCEPVDRASSRTLVMVSIVEPRKNQDGVLDACEQLWKRGLPCHLEVFGRVNPHFGRETERRMRHLARAGYPVRFHGNAPDAEVAAALAGARALLMPSIAEGCGLPILEALWNGVPVLCSDIPPFLETAEGGGCHVVRAGSAAALAEGMERLAVDDALVRRLTHEACSRPLPTWAETARQVWTALEG